VIFPINYVVCDDAILCRARRGGDLDRSTGNGMAAFEIDGADLVYHEGWSVLVIGQCVHLTNLSELDLLKYLRLLPWVGEERELFIRIALDEVSGRRIHHRSSSD